MNVLKGLKMLQESLPVFLTLSVSTPLVLSCVIALMVLRKIKDKSGKEICREGKAFKTVVSNQDRFCLINAFLKDPCYKETCDGHGTCEEDKEK